METLKGVVVTLDKKLQGASKPSDDVVSSTTGRLIDVELHDYQLEGLKWLAHRESAKLNVILGDEMGLGKTLQTIAFICFLDEIHKNAFKSSLIVAALSVLPNWQEQLQRFAPHLSVAVYSGEKTKIARRFKMSSRMPQLEFSLLHTSWCSWTYRSSKQLTGQLVSSTKDTV
ncbi:Chromodomain-helicase-DNA-binding protein 1-like [Aphanomyces cochlioides]|nr:Chromodomain-helicase-DNA-binding protein 1-like [Aphanomyces cochlioides]